ncbi:hypothetical protein [Streptomyces sp. SID8352]|uniref:hypothetical protein n=1 Tax=Streptomyces sp. SID8352 TaxID=2690338 RepID=UPI0013709F71|nr:hypothetical protein [Streptomyces sp. SID8352]MYU22057.1 hypothetical protein [Streptomyces sp. SID8352]
MPRFSVIVPAYQVRACPPVRPEPVPSPSYAGPGPIAVDDRSPGGPSPDARGGPDDETAARHGRVRPPARGGPGPAPDAGAEGARADRPVLPDGDTAPGAPPADVP